MAPTLLVTPMAGVAFLVLRSLDLVAHIPLWELLGILALGGLAGVTAHAVVSDRGWRLGVRVALDMAAVTSVIYATGWGPALGIGYVFSAIQNVSDSGSRATWPSVAFGTLGLTAGQIAIATGVAPTLVPEPGVHGLAALVTVGVGSAVVLHGLTARRAELAHRELRASEERFRALVEHASDAILVVDSGARVRYASPSAYTEFGFRPDELVGRAGWDFIHPDDLPSALEMFAHLLEDPRHVRTAELRAQSGDGVWRWFEIRATNRLEDPNVGGIVANVANITERRDLEALRMEFVANAAHELRNPLMTLVGMADLLTDPERELTPAVRAECQLTLRRQAARTRSLIANLLDLAQIERGELRVELGPIELLRAAGDALEAAPPPQDREVGVDVPGGLFALADRVRLEQVLTNLLENAYRYGGRHIAIGARPHGTTLELWIQDDGPGVPPEVLPQLFEPFRRGHDTAEVTGSGLGLALCRRIVEAFGGRIGYEPDGQGARFVLRLSAAAPQDSDAIPAS